MEKKFGEVQKQLAAHFPLDELVWRVQQAGKTGDGKIYAKVIPYVDARAIQERLDTLFTIGGWRDSYEQCKGGTICHLSLKLSGEWITKMDGSPETDIESFKGGCSKALVRAAVKFGIGRYLYDASDVWADVTIQKPNEDVKHLWNYAKLKDHTVYYWKTPFALKLRNAPKSLDKTQPVENTPKKQGEGDKKEDKDILIDWVDKVQGYIAEAEYGKALNSVITDSDKIKEVKKMIDIHKKEHLNG